MSPLLAYSPALSHAPLLFKALRNRGFWVAVGLALAGGHALWKEIQRRKQWSRLMQRRALSDRLVPSMPAPAQPTQPWHTVKRALETVLKSELPHLQEQDPLSRFVTWRDARDLISHLESELDVDLPDAKTVCAMTVGQLVAVIRRKRPSC